MSCINDTRPWRVSQVIVIKLREAIAVFEKRTGTTLSYADLAERTGLARATIEALGSRANYNTTLTTIDKLCQTLRCELSDLLEYSEK